MAFPEDQVAALQSLEVPFAAVDVLPDPRIRQELSYGRRAARAIAADWGVPVAQAKAVLGRQFLDRGNVVDAVIASAELQGLVVLICRCEAGECRDQAEALALDLKCLSEQLEVKSKAVRGPRQGC